MREIGIQPDSILLEPFGRNTAPAALIATLHALNSYENPLILILSSDHIIKMRKFSGKPFALVLLMQKKAE